MIAGAYVGATVTNSEAAVFENRQATPAELAVGGATGLVTAGGASIAAKGAKAIAARGTGQALAVEGSGSGLDVLGAARSSASAFRLNAKLTGEEIAGGHAFEKHVITQAEYPGVTTRSQFASVIEDVVKSGEKRTLSKGRTAYWKDGTVVIRNPRSAGGGTAFRPKTGYDYFLNVN